MLQLLYLLRLMNRYEKMLQKLLLLIFLILMLKLVFSYLLLKLTF